MAKFDALALEVEKPSRMAVLHPVTRQPLRDPKGAEAYIDLYSGDSEQARRQHRAIMRRRVAVRRTKLNVEEIEAEQIELLAVLTAGWYLLDLNGNPLEVPFSVENARELYGLAATAWLRDQVDEHIGDRGNFSKASSAS